MLTAPALLFALGVLAVLGVANALRPARGIVLVVASWGAAWITVELAPQLVVLSALAAIGLVALGGLAEWPGWVGLALLIAADAVAVPLLIIRARRTKLDIEGVVADLEPGEPAVPYPRSHLVLPFLAWTRRDVRREAGARSSSSSPTARRPPRPTLA